MSANAWDGQQVRRSVNGLRIKTVAVTANGGWSIYKWGGQFSGTQGLDEAYVPFFGAFGAAWDDPMIARWSANPLGMLCPEVDAAFATSGGGNGGRGGAQAGGDRAYRSRRTRRSCASAC